jgi:hypothetical protein
MIRSQIRLGRSAFAVSLFAALWLAGCGYRTGFTVPEQRAVGVAIFDNVSRERDLERELHSALTDSVQRLVDAPLVSPSSADLRIDGRITEYIRRSGIRNKDNVRLETGVRITIVASLVRPGTAPPDAASETEPAVEAVEVLRQVVVSDERGYLLEDPVGEARARELVLRHIADRVVIELFGDLAFPVGDQALPVGDQARPVGDQARPVGDQARQEPVAGAAREAAQGPP